MPKQHYKLSPSATSRWMNCPGSLELSEGLERKESSYAIEGTRAHDVAENALLRNVTAYDVTDDEEMAAAVQVYLNEIGLVRQSFDVICEHTEEKLKCLSIDEEFGGTSDHFMIYEDGEKIVLHVFDYKHGVGVPVDIVENLQVLSYFAIIESHYRGMIDEFRATIVQPRCFEGDAVQHWSCSSDRVQRHLQDVEAVQGKSHLEAGEHCRWCPAITICPEVEKHALVVAQNEFSKFVHDPEKLLQMHKLAPAIKKFLDQIDEAMVETFRDGSGGIPGHKLVERLSHRRWKGNEEQVTKQFKRLGIGKRQYVKETVKTPAQLEKELPEQEEKLQEMMERRVVGFKVVPESAKGKAVDFRVSEFERIES